MRSEKSVGRIIGVLLPIQLAGLMVPFILLLPMQQPPGFLENAAGHSFQIKIAVLLLFLNCALTIAISIVASPVFRKYSNALALCLLTASMIMFILQAIDNSYLLSMVSLSKEYTGTVAANQDVFHGLAFVLGATRRWVHYTELLAIDTWMFLFYGILLRFRLIPRALAAFGFLTVLLHTTGISLPLFLGYRSVTLMGATLAVSHVAVGLWLMVKGFADSQSHSH